jgi:hypothetical protein
MQDIKPGDKVKCRDNGMLQKQIFAIGTVLKFKYPNSNEVITDKIHDC